MSLKLDKLEMRLKGIFERSAHLFDNSLPQDLAHQLVKVMEGAMTRADDGTISAPSIYTIYLPQHVYESWRDNSEVINMLSENLQTAASEAGVVFSIPPLIRLAETSQNMENGFQISTTPAKGSTDQTAVVHTEKLKEDPALIFPQNAYLIIDGSNNYPLDKTVINIGRREDNHLMIDDPRISRQHAQIRYHHGQYILFDLNSTGGTFINGLRITQQVLAPGDVISLAGVSLIYGEENPGSFFPTTEANPERTSKLASSPSSTTS